jgi:diguanylate cyclase (GGDEF)-like protein
MYQDERLKREALGSLQDSTRRLQEVFETDSLAPTLLRQVRDMFNVRVAALVLFEGGPLPAAVTRLDLDDMLTSFEVARLPGVEELVKVAGSQPGGMVVGRPVEGTALYALQGDSPGDALVAALRDGDAVRGVLVAGDRIANAGPFRADQVSLFETLANHAAVALRNRYLVDRLRAEAQVNDHQARHDALTELPNRTLFHERLDAMLDGGATPCAVVLLDIDRFKEVNDTLGHYNGDRLLMEVAARLIEIVGPAGMVARLSGDEFAVLLAGHGTGHASIEEHAVEVARLVGTSFTTPFLIEGLELVMSASIGISLSPVHGSTADALIRRADVAMYNAKSERGTGYEVYHADRDRYSAARLALVGDLRTAVESDQIEVVYQMQVDAVTGRVAGAEALARWRHPVLGVLSPLEFIGLAEHAGLIRPLTECVLRLAVRDAARWRQRWPTLRIAVNLSPRSLLDPALPPLIRGLLAEHDLPPSALTLEVTESAIVGDERRVHVALLDLTSLGCDISIDDFGTGYSSFSYLRRLSVHELKVDRSFVGGMLTDASDRAIVELTIDLGHRLGKRVVAEGVETDRDAELLAEMGCDILQGYLISRPVSCAAFEEALVAREPRTAAGQPPRPFAGEPRASSGRSARIRSLPPATDGPLALRGPG